MSRPANVTPLRNAMSNQQWAERITSAWQKQLSSIFETGDLLNDAKKEMEEQGRYGEWIAMINDKLPFGRSAANKLMNIADDDRLRDAESIPHLPVSWGILHILTLLTDDQLEEGLKTKAINPKMSGKDAKSLRGIKPKEREEKQKSIADIIASHAAEISKVPRDDQVKIIRAVMEKLHIGIRDFADGHIKFGK